MAIFKTGKDGGDFEPLWSRTPADMKSPCQKVRNESSFRPLFEAKNASFDV
jgi:hypothetical protein